MKKTKKNLCFIVAVTAIGIGMRISLPNYYVSNADEFLMSDIDAYSTPGDTKTEVKKYWYLWVHECEISHSTTTTTTSTNGGTAGVSASAGASAGAAGKKVEGKVTASAEASKSQSTTTSANTSDTYKGTVGTCGYDKNGKGDYERCEDVPTFPCK